MINNGEYYLITTNAWFLAPDGEEYRAAWGKCTLFDAQARFGFTPTRPSTNWFCEVGEGENSIIIAGCQIHYAVKCSKRPVQRNETYLHETTKHQVVLGKIYFTEPQNQDGQYNEEYLKALRDSAAWIQNIDPENHLNEIRG